MTYWERQGVCLIMDTGDAIFVPETREMHLWEVTGIGELFSQNVLTMKTLCKVLDIVSV